MTGCKSAFSNYTQVGVVGIVSDLSRASRVLTFLGAYVVEPWRRIVAKYFDLDAVVLAEIDSSVDMRFLAKQFFFEL